MFDLTTVLSLAVDVSRYCSMSKWNDIENHIEGALEVFRDDDEERMAAFCELLLSYISDSRDQRNPNLADYWIQQLMVVMNAVDAYDDVVKHRSLVETLNQH